MIATIAAVRLPAAEPQDRRHPGFLFWLFAAVLIVAFSTRRSPDVTTGKLWVAAVVIAALLLVFYAVILRDIAVRAVHVWLAFFTLACFLNFPVAALAGIPAMDWARHALIIICLPGFAFGACLLSARAARVMYWVIAALCGAIMVYYLSFWLVTRDFTAVREMYNDAFWNIPGGVFASVICACLLYPFAMRSGRRWTAAALVLALTGVMATFARTYWIMTPAALAVATVLMARRGMLKPGRVALLAVLASVLAAVAGGVLLTAATARVQTAGLSGTQRLYESQAILAAMRAEPHRYVAGAGFGALFQETAVDTQSIEGGLGTNMRDFSHDFYLQLLWNTGVLGLGTWLAALASWLWLMARSRSPHAAGILAAVLAVSLGSFTYHPFGDLGWDVLTGLLLGIGCRLALQQGTPEREHCHGVR